MQTGTHMRCSSKIAIALVAAVAAAAACRSASTSSSRGTPTPGGPTEPAPAEPGGGGGASGGAPGTGGGGAGAGPDPEEESPVPYVHFDVNHVVSTGQSNSVAHEGRPVLTTQQPFENLMFDVGVMTSGACEREGCRAYQVPKGLLPLVEGDSFWYPVETMSSGLGNEAALLARTKHGDAKHQLLVSLAGRNGLTYWCLRKGSCNFIDPTYLVAFDESMRQVEDGRALAAAAGKSYVVRAITAIHGESDDYAYATATQEFPLDGTDGAFASVKSYADGLIEWQRDFEAGIKAVTGQIQPVPLLVSQFSGWNDIATSAVTQLQYEAHVRSNGKVVIVAPGYALDWAGDCRHYSNHGERRLGEYFGKAYARIVLEGRRWEPVRPRSVKIAGDVVTARFFVPAPPLVFDTERVVDPGTYGFEVVDGSGARIAITKVALAGPDTVTIQLASAPSGAPHLRYAYTGVPRTCPGRFVGPRGNLRDSDSTPSQYGYELFNWAIHFDTPIKR